MDPVGIANSFLNVYYKAFSDDRAQLKQFYSSDSICTWEKKNYYGPAEIGENIDRMSAANLNYHHIDQDVQVTPGDMLLILVNGQVSIDAAPAVAFSHTFLLTRTSTGSWYIRNEIFKFGFAL